jgi:hypothetical protein
LTLQTVDHVLVVIEQYGYPIVVGST